MRTIGKIMRQILPQKFTVVFFLQNSIDSDKVFNLAEKLNSSFSLKNIQINNTFSVPKNIPAPFPWIVATLPCGWKLTIGTNRIDCIQEHVGIQNENLPNDFYHILTEVFEKILSSGFVINRMGSVAQFQDITPNSCEKISAKYSLPALASKKPKLNALAFCTQKNMESLDFFDNVSILRQEMLFSGQKIDSFIFIRDINTGNFVSSFSSKEVKAIFNISEKLLSVAGIEEEIYGHNDN